MLMMKTCLLPDKSEIGQASEVNQLFVLFVCVLSFLVR